MAVVDDDPSVRVALERLFRSDGLRVECFESARGFLERTPPTRPGCLVLDVRMPKLSGLDLQEALRESASNVPIVFLTGHGDVPMSVRAMKAGAEDFLQKPFAGDQLLAAVRRALERRGRARASRAEVERLLRDAASLPQRDRELFNWVARGLPEAEDGAPEKLARLLDRMRKESPHAVEALDGDRDFEEIVGRSASMVGVTFKAQQVAATDATVLILGETGSGKGLVARAIHDRSRRRERPLVTIDCSTLPAGLIESELFGHEKGAYTGATGMKPGRFEAADGGTVFLDEVGELPLDLQVKLLRVLEDGTFERVGGTRVKSADVRVIAATNRDLRTAAQEKRFRPDLFYRLNVFPIEVPPLRDRREDIPLLASYFVSQLNRKLGRSVDRIPASTMEALQAYDWPGNVRELQNVLEGALVVSPGQELEPPNLPGSDPSPPAQGGADLDEKLRAIERARILEALEASSWKVKGTGNAAARLGLTPSTLRSRMKKLGIERPD